MSTGTFSARLTGFLCSLPIIMIPIIEMVKVFRQVEKHKDLTYWELFVCNTLLLGAVSGGYNLYFWTQKVIQDEKREAYIMPVTAIDQAIPYSPIWSLPYSFLYFVFPLPLLFVENIEQFVYILFGGYLCLGSVVVCFYFFPNTVPDYFRKPPKGDHRDFTERFLHFVQGYDQNTNNACPSAHCVFAVYLAIVSGGTLYWTWMIWLFPILIALSCLFTKQHVFIDTILGSALGGAGGYFTLFLMPK